MAQDPALDQPITAPIQSAEAGQPNKVEEPPSDDLGEIDIPYWIACLEDAERAERDWRSRGREIVEIYRNQKTNARSGKISNGKITFNVLYANTEVMLPAVYQKPPEPVVKSRYVKLAAAPMMPPMPPGMPPMPGGPPMGAPPGAMPPPPAAALAPPPPAGPPPGPPMPGLSQPIQPPPMPPFGGPPMPAGPMPGLAPPLPAMAAPPMAGPPMPAPAPGRPPQADIETAASVMQRALKIVVEDEQSDEAVKMAIKDVLLPGRGTCRVRWRPQLTQTPVMAGDGLTPLPNPQEALGIAPPGHNGGPPMEEKKVWEDVGDEYVYWEDLLVDPVRAAADMNWIAFRHLFTEQGLEREFSGAEQYEKLKAANRLSDILRWTDESAAKSPVGGGSPMKTASKLGDHIKKAMVWEIWDKNRRGIIWFIREASGIVMRVDPDSYQLEGFFPIPAPMLAVVTTDSRIPRAFYDEYAQLAEDLDECCVRISRLIKQIKVRGGYNSASREIADILTAEDGKMIGIDGVDMLGGGLQNHIWIVPIDIWMAALDKLLIAKETLKQSIYEIMGISDIMRGVTRASETATAQRIKGTMGVSRLEDARMQAKNFVRDLLRLKAELIGQNFDAATLEAMTGEAVTPQVMEILRSDFLRMCTIDIQSDSTIEVDEQAEQQSMAQIMGAIQQVMMGTQGMLQTGMLPPVQVIQLALELLKMALHPIRHARPVVDLITDFQEQLQMQAMMPPPPMMPMPGAAPPGPPPPGANGAIPPQLAA